LGAGAEARRPLGIAVVGGVLLSTFLTLVVVPVVYTLLTRFTKVEVAPFNGNEPVSAHPREEVVREAVA
jgi:hypothetical protein